jgi:molecular chaperone GrpE
MSMDNNDDSSGASGATPNDQTSGSPPRPAGDGSVPGDGAGAPTSGEAAAPAGVAVPTSLLGRAVTDLQEALRTSHDRMLRLAADHENYKKRSRKEANDAVRQAEEKTVEAFLPVMDNLERALAHAEAGGGLVEGVGMVHKQFLSVLERLGIKPIESMGQPFDPERHEAIQQAPSPLPPGTVCQEAQRGYLRGDRLVRPAMVVVSLGPVSAPAAEGDEQPTEGPGAGAGAKPNGGEP